MLYYLPDIEAVLKIPLAEFIKIYANVYGYYWSAHDFIVNWINTMLWKAKSAAIKEDDPNLWDPMNSNFTNDYWKADLKEVETLEKMGAW